MFKSIKDQWKKAEAAAIIQTGLEDQNRLGYFTGDPAKTANRIVLRAWDFQPEIYDGRFGVRPHKLTIAVTSLILAVEETGPYHEQTPSLMLVLGALLQGLASNELLLPLVQLDFKLIEQTAERFERLNVAMFGTEINNASPSIECAAPT